MSRCNASVIKYERHPKLYHLEKNIRTIRKIFIVFYVIYSQSILYSGSMKLEYKTNLK